MLTKNNRDTKSSTVLIKPLSEEKRRQEESYRDVLLLLENLLEREEKTVLMIIDCLYDVGSVNLVNKKVPSRPFNNLLKSILKYPKPVFRIIALIWVKKKSPLLITNFLYEKVKF